MDRSKYDLAEENRKAENYKEGLPIFAELWLAEPSALIGWRYAQCLRKVGQADQAERVAREALELFPGDKFTISQLAWALKTLERYPEAADLFGSIQPDDFSIGGYVLCLRKSGKLDQAEAVARDGLVRKPDDRFLKQELGWVIYSQKLKPAKEDSDLDAVLSAANEIMDLAPDKMLVSKVVLAVFNVAKHQNNIPWRIILNWADKVTPQEFETEPKDYGGRKGMPDREVYYLGRAKALFETKQYQEAQIQTTEGLQDFPRSFFLVRLGALVQEQLGDIQGAAEIMRELQRHRQCTWYATAELAVMERQLGRLQEAFRLMSGALSRARQDPQYLLTHLVNMAEILVELGKLEAAAVHIQLARVIRTNRNWNIRQNLTEVEEHISAKFAEAGRTIPVMTEDESNLIRACRSYWGKNDTNTSIRKQGTLLPARNTEDPFRFIKPVDGGEKVFAHKRNLPHGWREGMKVEFGVVPSYDKKRDRESVEAVDIRADN